MNPTETNSRVQLLRSLIGQSFSRSPSPVGRWLNGILRAVEPDSLTVDYTVREEMCNSMMTLHGGIAAAILDDLMGTVVFLLGREYAHASINLSVDYLHNARPGEVVTATARVVRAGRNIVHTEGSIQAADGKLIAKAAGNLIQTSFRLPG